MSASESTASLTHFPPFHLDVSNERLVRGAKVIALRHRSFAVLRLLVQRSGRLVTKEELLQTVWPGAHVTDVVLAVCISELRKALGDTLKRPRFIETVHRRGYRFIGKIKDQEEVTRGREPKRAASQVVAGRASRTTPLFGRSVELAHLQQSWAKALHGQRQVVFVSGHPGMGKTALVDAFMAGVGADAAAPDAILIAHGHCIEQGGSREPFMPVLEGLGRLCTRPQGMHLVNWLREHAPSWLLQLPGLISVAEREMLQRAYASVTHDRMLREMVVGIEALTAERPLMLVLEDLHWSDASTLELVSALAHRREDARLLVLATYRPVDVVLTEHPLKAVNRDLEIRCLCDELILEPLSEAAVHEYLTLHLRNVRATPILTRPLAAALHQHTGGNPLFMVHVTQQLITKGVPAGTERPFAQPSDVTAFFRALPSSLHEMIERQLERLTAPERALLEAGGVTGIDFSAEAVAAALGDDPERVEAGCTTLARHGQFIRSAGRCEWPDQTQTAVYRFAHPFYRVVLYEHVSAQRRVRSHQRIAERLERGYGLRAPEIAGQLAVHFDGAGAYARAVHYHHLAGEAALQRSAYPEAISHANAALDAIVHLPATPERQQQELDLLLMLGPLLVNAHGSSAAEIARVYSRARELCGQNGNGGQLFAVLAGVELYWRTHGKLDAATAVAREVFTLAERSNDRTLLIEGHRVMGCNRFWAAELTTAREHLEQAVALYDRDPPADAYRLGGHDPKIRCLTYLGTLLWLKGHPDAAVDKVQSALARAAELAHPPSAVLGHALSGWVYVLRRESHRVREVARAARTLAAEHGFPFWEAIAAMMLGWALLDEGQAADGLETLETAYATYKETGGASTVDFHMLMVDAYLRSDHIDAGLRTVDEAFDVLRRFRQCYFEAELHRLKGELLLRSAAGSAAEESFTRALDIAGQQHAPSLALRAATSLGRHWQQRGQAARARRLLGDVYGQFEEGFDTPDVREARGLLADLDG